MGEVTGISWTHHTLNIFTGCTKVSAACKFCYAETLSKRNLPNVGKWGPKAPRRPMAETGWKNLRNWDRKAKAAGARRRVFCSSLSDIGEKNETMPEESWPVVAAQRARLWDEIERCDGLDFLLLTKRPDHLAELLAERWPNGLPPNIWAGTSVEDQAAADARIPKLLEIPARVCFLSCEPLLGPVEIDGNLFGGPGGFRGGRAGFMDEGPDLWTSRVGWVIVGGESGVHARPMHPDWARSLRDQCVAAGVSFHFKQSGEFLSLADLAIAERWNSMTDRQRGNQQFVNGTAMVRVGKHLAGRLLDGREWNEVPGEA